MSRKSSFFYIFRNCLLGALVTVAFCLLFLEGYLRISGYLKAQPANYPCTTGDATLNHVFQKNCEEIGKADALRTEKDVTYKTNELGIRGPMPRLGTIKLLLIGDSYTEGFGLEEFESLTAQLQSQLNKYFGSKLQVLNGGTMGYTASLYPIYYEKKFSSIKPEYVLAHIDLSDFNDEGYYLQIADYDANNEPEAFPWRDPIPSVILNFIYSNGSAALRFFHSEFTQARLALGRAKMKSKMDTFVNKGPHYIKVENLRNIGQDLCWNTYEAIAKGMIKLKNLVEKNGGRMGIHMYPPGTTVKEVHIPQENFSFVQILDQKLRKDYSWACGVNNQSVEVFQKFAQENEIDFYNSFPFVLSQKDKKDLYFERDAHWNSKGVKRVAAHLSKELAKHIKSLNGLHAAH